MTRHDEKIPFPEIKSIGYIIACLKLVVYSPYMCSVVVASKTIEIKLNYQKKQKHNFLLLYIFLNKFFVFTQALFNKQNFHLQYFFMLYLIFDKLHLYMSINHLNRRNNQCLKNLCCAISVLLNFHKKITIV